MPESRRRKKPAQIYTPPPKRSPNKTPSPPWYGGLILALFGIGVVWLVLYYTTNGTLPVSALNGWNVLVGFGFIIGGFGLSTRWR